MHVKHDKFDFSNLENNHELYEGTERNVFDKIQIKTPKSIDLGEIPALRAKTYANTCDEEKASRKKFTNYRVGIEINIRQKI